MRTSDFDYALPPDLIAQTPLPDRDASRLLVLDRGTGGIRHCRFADLPDLLTPGDTLVLNESRVIPARLRGHKTTGGAVELLLSRPVDGRRWTAMTRPGLRPGSAVAFEAGLSAAVEAVESDGLRLMRFNLEGPALDSAIAAVGAMPTPPYIRAPLHTPERYQTVYARESGSVAAPTAGLHFTDAMFDALRRRGIIVERLVLHVGLGTFQPVKVDDPVIHPMHSEWMRVDTATAERINEARAVGRRILAVGTTVVRALETAADAQGRLAARAGETTMLILPGYRFRVVDGMLTNFHQPKSTLLMLVSAFAGQQQVLAAYAEAIRHRYRFLSFGDCCLLL